MRSMLRRSGWSHGLSLGRDWSIWKFRSCPLSSLPGSATVGLAGDGSIKTGCTSANVRKSLRQGLRNGLVRPLRRSLDAAVWLWTNRLRLGLRQRLGHWLRQRSITLVNRHLVDRLLNHLRHRGRWRPTHTRELLHGLHGRWQRQQRHRRPHPARHGASLVGERRLWQARRLWARRPLNQRVGWAFAPCSVS